MRGPPRRLNLKNKGLDFRCCWSVTAAMLIGPGGPFWIPPPLAMPPLWGFGGDGASAVTNGGDWDVQHSKTSKKAKPSRAKIGAKTP